MEIEAIFARRRGAVTLGFRNMMRLGLGDEAEHGHAAARSARGSACAATRRRPRASARSAARARRGHAGNRTARSAKARAPWGGFTASRSAIFSNENSRLVRDSIFTARRAISANAPSSIKARKAARPSCLLPALVRLPFVVALQLEIVLVAEFARIEARETCAGSAAHRPTVPATARCRRRQRAPRCGDRFARVACGRLAAVIFALRCAMTRHPDSLSCPMPTKATEPPRAAVPRTKAICRRRAPCQRHIPLRR